MSANVAGTIALTNAVIMYPRDTQPQGVTFSEFFVPLQCVPPKFIWLNFVKHVGAINVAKRTFFYRVNLQLTERFTQSKVQKRAIQ